LANVNKRPERGRVVSPGGALAIEEERQAQSAIRGELRVRGDNLGARTVVDRERNDRPIAREPKDCP
jgi:hypothetical protein